MEYTVFLEKENGIYIATIPVLPGCQTKGATEQEAIENIRTQVMEKLSHIKMVSVEVDILQTSDQTHPWKRFAGMWKDDPTFDNFLTEIQAERHNQESQTA